MVAHVAELEGTIREQAETIGTLRAELAAAMASQTQQEAQQTASAPEPSPKGHPRRTSPSAARGGVGG